MQNAHVYYLTIYMLQNNSYQIIFKDARPFVTAFEIINCLTLYNNLLYNG